MTMRLKASAIIAVAPLDCPLCFHLGVFKDWSSYRDSFVSLTTRSFPCPACHVQIQGVDKFALHLVSHELKTKGSPFEQSLGPMPSCHLHNQTLPHETDSYGLQPKDLEPGSNSHPHTDHLEAISSLEELLEACASGMRFQQNDSEGEPSLGLPEKKLPAIQEKTRDLGTPLFSASDLGFSNPLEEVQAIPSSASKIEDFFSPLMSNEPKGEASDTPIKITGGPTNFQQDRSLSPAASEEPPKPSGSNESLLRKLDLHVVHIGSSKSILDAADPEVDGSAHNIVKNPNSPPTSSPVQCDQCGWNFDNENFLQLHTVLMHSPHRLGITDDSSSSSLRISPSTTKKRCQWRRSTAGSMLTLDEYRCKECSQVFSHFETFTSHMQDAHNDHRFICSMCSKPFKLRGSLLVHQRVVHLNNNPTYELSAEILQPPESLKGWSSDGSLTTGGHQNLCSGDHFQEKSLSQGETEEYAESKFDSVEQHLLGPFNNNEDVMNGFKKFPAPAQAHESRQWDCDVCKKSFTTKYFLKKHKRLHTGEMPYQCSICGKSFTFQQSYHKHMLYHTDEKPYTCLHCGRAFKELSTLQNHERIHSGERPFACETCGKSFRQRVSYLVHRRIHTGAMPYSCSACGRNFRYKVTQRTHKCNGATANQAASADSPVVSSSASKVSGGDAVPSGTSGVLSSSDPSITFRPPHLQNTEENLQQFRSIQRRRLLQTCLQRFIHGGQEGPEPEMDDEPVPSGSSGPFYTVSSPLVKLENLSIKDECQSGDVDSNRCKADTNVW